MAPFLKVAVCTNRPPAEIGEALSALVAQVPAERLALVTSGLADDQVAAHTAAFDGPLLSEPRNGLSRARNRALAWCEAEDVLAFVDDDAVAEPDWYASLERAWAEADAEVACIGGPIRPRFPGDPPAWLSDPLLPVLTVLELGPPARDLDPFETTVFGANISFRVGPLRAAGGFDPAYGHAGSRVFFSEEDEAQRALARLGHRVMWTPGAAVQHVIPAERLTRRSFVRRRFAYGRALGMRGARSRGVALRQALRSGAGCLPAALRGDGRLLMERAVRAAENAGVLVAR